MGIRSALRSVVFFPPRPPDFPVGLPYYTTVNGQQMPFQTLAMFSESIGTDFAGLINGAYKANGIVFAVELARRSLFMQARFQYRQLRSGRPGDYFGNASLGLLENPWPNGTTGDLLGRMIDYADFGGDCFVVRRPDHLAVLRADWTILVSGSMDDSDVTAWDVDAKELGILYFENGIQSGAKPKVFLVGEYAHFVPLPDPLSPGRGMSWVVPILRDVQGDSAATTHKLRFLENGATPNMIVSNVPGATQTAFNEWVDAFEKHNKGTDKAGKTLFLQGSTTASVVGSNLQQLDFSTTQGAGEVRIAAAGGVPASVVGLSESLSGSMVGSGNFGSAMRRFADMTMRPLWQNAAGSLEAIFPAPGASQLWYDDRDIPALKDDIKDRAEVQNKQGATIRTLTDAGFKPETVVSAVLAGDFTLLKHSGLYSVQLQPPGTVAKPVIPDPNMPDMPASPGGTP
jgi:hypothetical protein